MNKLLVTCIAILLTFNLAWGDSYIKFPNGDSYYGEVRDGKPHGQGIFRSSGDNYAGEFRNGKYVGNENPSESNQDGATYQTNTSSGTGANTEGLYTYIKFPYGAPSKYGRYIGELRDGKPHGQGTFRSYNGKEFIGEFRDGEYVGEGKPNVEAARQYQEKIESDGKPNCWLALSAGFGAPNGSGNFGESFGNAMSHYNNCKAGLPPPPKKPQIICNTNRVNNSVSCYEQ